MSFGRQKNLVRRAVRPDGRFTRDARRKGAGKNILLEAGMQKPTLGVRLAKMIAKLFKR